MLSRIRSHYIYFKTEDPIHDLIIAYEKDFRLDIKPTAVFQRPMSNLGKQGEIFPHRPVRIRSETSDGMTPGLNFGVWLDLYLLCICVSRNSTWERRGSIQIKAAVKEWDTNMAQLEPDLPDEHS